MDNVTFDVHEIQINSLSFQYQGDNLRFESYPRKITYKGRQYVLAEA